MDFSLVKKLLKSNHVKFLLAIFVSILIHLFLLGGIDMYNPFFLENSDSLNIVIESHLESPTKDQEVSNQKKLPIPKKEIKRNKRIDNNFIEKKEASNDDSNANSETNEINQFSQTSETEGTWNVRSKFMRAKLIYNPKENTITYLYDAENKRYSKLMIFYVTPDAVPNASLKTVVNTDN